MANLKLVKSATALVLGASVLTSAVAVSGTDASAASSYKVTKSGKLVYKKSGKVVKGYKTYNKVLYKNGVKFTGTKSGVYYKAGKKFSGVKSGKLYQSGKKVSTLTLYKGTLYKKGGAKNTGKVVYKGKLYNGSKQNTTTTTYNKKLYKGASLWKGYHTWTSKLYKDGVLNVGTYLHDNVLYKDATQNVGLALYKEKLYDGITLNKGLAEFEGKLYDGAAVSTGFKEFNKKFYNNGVLANGEINGVEYKDGVVVKYEVKSVKAINAEELQVTFAQAVSTTATVGANYEVTLNGVKTVLNTTTTTAKNANIVLSEDGKTATVRLLPDTADNEGFAKFKAGDKISVQVSDGVKTKEGKTLERYASETFAFESVAPKLISASAKSTSSAVTLTFDQPVATANDSSLIKIDGYEVAKGLNKLTPVAATTPGSYSYTVSLASLTDVQKKAVLKEGAHQVALFDVANTASSNPAVSSVLNVNYTISNAESAPKVTSVKAINANKFFITFDQDIKSDSFKLEVSKGTLAFTTNVSELAGDSAGDLADNSTAYVQKGSYDGVTGYYVAITDTFTGDVNPLYKDLEKSATVNVKVSEFQSASGLLGTVYNQALTLSKDSIKPTIVNKVLADDGSKITLTFDQPLNNATFDASKVVLKDANGVILKQGVSEAYTVAQIGDAVTLTAKAGTKFDAEPYTVEFAKEAAQYAVDKSTVTKYSLVATKNDAFTVSVGKSAADNTKYYALGSANRITTVGTNKVLVDFGTKMDAATVKDIKNYKLDGVDLAGATIDFYGDTKHVLITFPEGTFKQNATYRLTIAKDVLTEAKQQVVKDAQSLDTYVGTFSATDNAAPTITGAKFYVASEDYTKVPTTNKIQLTFSEELQALANTNDDVKLVINGQVFDGTLTLSTTDKSVVYFTTTKDINVNESATIKVFAEADQKDTTAGIKDLAGNKAAAGEIAVSGKAIDASAAKDLQDAAELAVAKTTAKSALDSYKSAADYTVNTLTAAITTGKTNIDNATTTAGVDAALATAKSAIDAINSDQKLANDEVATLNGTPTFAANGAANAVVLPTVSNGTIAVKTTSDPGKYDLNGKVIASGTSTVKYTVTVGSKTATTDDITVTVTVAP